jgi:hypothetical protein
MSLSAKDWLKETVSVGGTGALTLGGASSGFQAFAAGDDGKLFPYSIQDGTAWETGIGTYTHAGTSFARTTRYDSSTGAALNVTTNALLFVDLIGVVMAGHDSAMASFIRGLIVTKHAAANTLDISAGTFYDPVTLRIVEYAGTSGLSAGVLGVSQWNQVYVYDNAGTATIEVVNNADPPSTTYAGTARKGGTGGNRRWIGSFLTDGSSNIRDMLVNDLSAVLQVIWTVNSTPSAPMRVLNAGVATTFTAVSLAGCVPKSAATEVLLNIYLSASVAGHSVNLSKDGTNNNLAQVQCPGSTGAAGFIASILWMPFDTTSPQIWYEIDLTGPSAYIDVFGHRFAR